MILKAGKHLELGEGGTVTSQLATPIPYGTLHWVAEEAADLNLVDREFPHSLSGLKLVIELL
jgi:hypothetical protein